MGFIHVTVSVRASARAKKRFQSQFLVDAGDADSMAPASQLRQIGIEPAGRIVYELADGTPKELEFGLGVIEFMGDITAGRVIFGPEGTEPILGVTALESTGIMVNPKDQTLKRLPAIPLKGARNAGAP
jgi:predicted aspartyl protease